MGELLLDLLKVLAGMAFAGLGYLVKRQVERKKDSEQLDRDKKVLEINRELIEQQISIEEFDALKARYLEKRTHYQAEMDLVDLKREAANERNTKYSSNIEMKTRTALEVDKVKAELRVVLHELESLVLTAQRPHLRQAQELWEVYAEEHAKYVAMQYHGGTHYSLAYSLELELQYLIRIGHLKHEIKDFAKR